MSGHEPRFNATIWTDHPARMSELSRKLDAGETPTEAEKLDLREFAGGLNYSYAHQGEFVPVPAPPGPGPTPTPGDPLARIKAAPSQWAKWLGLSDVEAQALIDGQFITREQKNQNNNWWQLNGVKGRYEAATGRYLYFTYPGGVETTNVDTGGADAATEAASGQKVPGPALP